MENTQSLANDHHLFSKKLA